jgi:class 3 adenylate cyclase/DNA-binding beta-propeller fold protein YncE
MRPSSSGRILAAVLFTDMVNSTTVAEELGDRRWKALTAQHHRIVRRELKKFGGREIDTAGDGFFATFREPAAAIACACAASEAVRELGVEIRAAVHFGECEQLDKKLSGITVVVGARLMALGGAGDVLVSNTAAELARGAGYGLVDRGTHELKGVGGEWKVFAVDSVEGVPRARPLDAMQAAERRAAIAPEDARTRIARPALVAGVAAAAVVAAALVFALSRPSQATPPGPDTIARIDEAGEGFDAEVAAGARAFPEDIVFDGASLWVANVGNRTLVRLDPEGSRDPEVFGTPSPPTGVAFADGQVWVTYGFISDPRRAVDVLDPADALLRPADIAVPSGSYPIATGDGALWIADFLGSTIVRRELASGRTSSIELPAGSGPTSLDVGGGSLWVAAGRQPSVFRIDTVDPGQPADRFGTGGDVPTALSVAPDGTVWIVAREADSVLALSSSGTTRVDLVLGDRCDGPGAVEATEDAIWVSCSTSSSVVRLRPSDGSIVDSLAVEGEPGPMATDGTGAVWVGIRGT